MGLGAKFTPRILFWILFLCLAVFAFGQIWLRLDPLRNHPVIATWWFDHNVGRLKSSNPKTGVAAWVELERLYLTRWSAYDRAVWHVKQRIWQADEPKISFCLRRSGNRFNATIGPGPSECRTVTEALMAILHQEEFTRVPYAGNWRVWWEANWNYFPNRELKALPSGPEAPRGRK